MMDFLEHNLAILAASQPRLAEAVRAAEPLAGAAVEPGRRGEPCLRVGDQRLTSAVDPAAEGAGLAARAPAGPLVVLGLGLGHHLEPLLERDLVVLQPEPGLLRVILSGRDLAHLLGRVRLAARLEDLPDLAGRGLLVHPSTARLFPGLEAALRRRLSGLEGAAADRPPRPERPRVLVVPPIYGGSLPVARWCAEALADLGCEVISPPLEGVGPLYDLVRAAQAGEERRDRVRAPMIRFLGEMVELMAEESSPHLCLALAQAPLDRRAIGRLEALGVPTAFWFIENARAMPYFREVAASYGHFFHIQPSIQAELESLGARAAYLPMAAHPPVHRALALGPADQERYGADLGFMGEGYPNRRRIFARLAEQGLDFALWGTGWPAEGPLADRVREGGRRLDTAEVVKVYNACAMVLNLHSSPTPDDALGAADFVNPRAFEIAACGGFQLVDRVAGLEELLAPGREVVTYGDEAELRELAAHYAERPDQRAGIAQAGRRRILAEHTYYHRMERLLSICLGPAPAGPLRDQPAGGTGALDPTAAAGLLLLNLTPPDGPG